MREQQKLEEERTREEEEKEEKRRWFQEEKGEKRRLLEEDRRREDDKRETRQQECELRKLEMEAKLLKQKEANEAAKREHELEIACLAVGQGTQASLICRGHGRLGCLFTNI